MLGGRQGRRYCCGCGKWIWTVHCVKVWHFQRTKLLLKHQNISMKPIPLLHWDLWVGVLLFNFSILTWPLNSLSPHFSSSVSSLLLSSLFFHPSLFSFPIFFLLFLLPSFLFLASVPAIPHLCTLFLFFIFSSSFCSLYLLSPLILFWGLRGNKWFKGNSKICTLSGVNWWQNGSVKGKDWK